MQDDRITWNTLNFGFCRYKFQSKTQVFCRNEFNVTGLCAEKSCPLANSRYATIREENGICYLYIKTIERSHFPNKLWEKVKLSRNMEKAKEQIKSELIYWPRFNIVKCNQRLLKITEYLNRVQKLKLTSNKELIPIRRKIDRREKRKEVKALRAANLETNIEKELIQRLKNGMYNELYSFPLSAFDKAMTDPKRELMEEDESDAETVREYVIDSDIESEFELSDIEDLEREMAEIGDWKVDLQKQKQYNMPMAIQKSTVSSKLLSNTSGLSSNDQLLANENPHNQDPKNKNLNDVDHDKIIKKQGKKKKQIVRIHLERNTNEVEPTRMRQKLLA